MTNVSCSHPGTHEEHWKFCPACGARLSHNRWPRIYHVGLPLLAALVSFVPWVRVGLGSHLALWTVYQVSPGAWAWLIIDLAVMVASAWPQGGMSYRMMRLWQLLGAGTLAVGVTVLISVSMAGKVSAILSAPSPIHLSAGLGLFIVVVAVWALLALVES